MSRYSLRRDAVKTSEILENQQWMLRNETVVELLNAGEKAKAELADAMKEIERLRAEVAEFKASEIELDLSSHDCGPEIAGIERKGG